ncbi:poly-gamma-glutamate hydrolase family protein [Staphylococcus sp. NRL 16/872]|uniref:poly-gamma-glutamate hydrolase family protein n=1 Tax=Staphylococcus sp. NRL 16/872 TaxID=2930131 RepID=UPI001FB4FFE9|nr:MULTISPECIES: poly-gamma-glutamate hydrolase family protein [unclassified Staphylococcus]MCJ1655432.1 poly-gamma-glutamate hydrolase family protein [Staphylococcus sp. NRL 21/187]MCJ1667155.1 poly-gamma-glutamate hydrolase family protein [Staphylococcus sp. NRL 19/737]WEN69637.1 poly-gamma-glutamate hydrolase family protein [Staphylococcus sp. NRL 16/872]
MKKIKLNTSIVTNKWLMGIATTAIGISTFSLLQDQAHAAEHNYQKMQQNAPLNKSNWDNEGMDSQSNYTYDETNTIKQSDNEDTSSYLSEDEIAELANEPDTDLTSIMKQPKPSPAPVMEKSTLNTNNKQINSNTNIISKPAPSNKPSTPSKPVLNSIKSNNKVQTSTIKPKPKSTIVNKQSTNTKPSSQYKVKKPSTSQTVKKSNVKPTAKPVSKKQSNTKNVKKTSSTKATLPKKAVTVYKTSTKAKKTVSTKSVKKVTTKTTTSKAKPTTKTTVHKKVTPPAYQLGKVKPTDTYRSMSDLFAHTTQGIDWQKERSNKNSNVLIFAPHGGNIEKGTTELAKAIANKGNYDYYAFNAIRNGNNKALHVTSTNYDDKDLINTNYNRDVSVSVHGAGQAQGYNTVLMGGRDTQLLGLISQELKKFKFNVQRATGYLAGTDANNIVNFNKKGMGVQLEITPDIRKSFFKDGNDASVARKVVTNWTSRMDNFATAVSNAIKKYKF